MGLFPATTEAVVAQGIVSGIFCCQFARIDYAQLIKIYGEPRNPEKRYSPARYDGSKKEVISVS